MVSVEGNSAESRFYCPQAEQVFLVGDFNAWRHGELAMTPETGGYWRATISLPKGEYRFRYWADGQWHLDYASFGLDISSYGYDSVVRICA